MNIDKKLIKHWSAEAAKHLLNRKIVEVRYLSAAEVRALGWYASALVIQLDDGSLFYPSADDEGNDAGAMFGQGPNGESITLPVIR